MPQNSIANDRQTKTADSSLKSWIRALERTAPIIRNPAVTLPILIDQLADKFESAPALISSRGDLTYRQLSQRSRLYAAWALEQGLCPGETVCLLMPNCADYFAIWLGITRVGGIVSLVNTNLSGDSLAHAIKIVKPRHIIADSELLEKVAAIIPRIGPQVGVWSYGDNSLDLPRIESEIGQIKDRTLTHIDDRAPSISDRALYIYTSGTTGLPKAANVSHYRLMQWSQWFAGMMDTGPEDRMYNCLPMYHSVGGVVAIGATLANGGAVVLRERFSASRFWNDIVESRATIFQYIGELCRYLVNSPLNPRETEHQLRLACGNGMAGDVWERFQQRFGVPRVLEFYAATEGTFSLYNCEGRPGAIGRIPSFLAHRFPIALVKFDPESNEPVRSEEGLCIRCAANEVGEALGKVTDDRSGTGGFFEGYADKAATEKKILRNVLAQDDAWFRTGDLMRKDEKGFYYFVDRVGDTFRWKGENVSTTEVASIICGHPEVSEAVVYGVDIPRTEGRAGMAAVVIKDGFDISDFRAHLVKRLPEYACPLFLRIRGNIEVTATMKPRKSDLQREGCNPGATEDAIYLNDLNNREFVRIDQALFERIQNGSIRL